MCASPCTHVCIQTYTPVLKLRGKRKIGLTVLKGSCLVLSLKAGVTGSFCPVWTLVGFIFKYLGLESLF